MYQSKHPVKEHLVAVRMNWLYWLATPVRWLWSFIVFIWWFFWSLVVIAWQGMRRSFSPVPLAIGAAGGAVTMLVVVLFAWLALISGFRGLAGIGAAIAALPMAWTCGEIASLMKYREVTGQFPAFGNISYGNGAAVAGYLLVYVVVIVLMIALQAAFDLLAHIPVAGPGLVAILLVPNVLASGVALAALVCLAYGVSVLPAHLLHAEEADEGWAWRVWHMSSSYMGEIGRNCRWLRFMLLGLPAAFFGILASVPVSILVGASLGITAGVGMYMAPDAFRAFTAVYGAAMSGSGVFTVPVFFLVISLSLLAGAAFSAYFATCAASYYLLYGERNYRHWLGDASRRREDHGEEELDLL